MYPHELITFETVYRRHVDLVVQGDFRAILEDMAPEVLPKVFEGVHVPRGDVRSATVRSVRLDGERAVGEAVYVTPTETIGLRSGWRAEGEGWKADTLENFDVSEAS